MQSVYYRKSVTKCDGNNCKTVSMDCKDGVCHVQQNNMKKKQPQKPKSSVHIVARKGCKWCTNLKKMLKRKKIPFKVHIA